MQRIAANFVVAEETGTGGEVTDRGGARRIAASSYSLARSLWGTTVLFLKYTWRVVCRAPVSETCRPLGIKRDFALFHASSLDPHLRSSSSVHARAEAEAILFNT